MITLFIEYQYLLILHSFGLIKSVIFSLNRNVFTKRWKPTRFLTRSPINGRWLVLISLPKRDVRLIYPRGQERDHPGA